MTLLLIALTLLLLAAWAVRWGAFAAVERAWPMFATPRRDGAAVKLLGGGAAPIADCGESDRAESGEE